MLRIVTLWATISIASAFAVDAHTTHTLFDGRLEVTLSDAYEIFEAEGVDDSDGIFVRLREFGDFPKEIKVGEPVDLGDWFPDHASLLEFILYQIVPLSEELRGGDLPKFRAAADESARSLHDRYCHELGERSFRPSWIINVFDEETGIGVCVETVGYFVAYFTRRMGDKFLAIGANATGVPEDRVGDELPENFRELPAADQFDFFKVAANTDDAMAALKSARLVD
jgi:hypothetical protein